jgi:hypothetical protein
MKASIQLKKEVLKRTDDLHNEGYHQTIMDIMYEHWQDNISLNYFDALQWFETKYGELAKFALLVGKYNQQVCNGGHIQYFHNGYTDGKGGCFISHDEDIPLHKELIKLFSNANLDNDTAKKVLQILYDFEVDLDEDYELINRSYLDRLDHRYYELDIQLMNTLEQYFKNKITEQEDEQL